MTKHSPAPLKLVKRLEQPTMPCKWCGGPADRLHNQNNGDIIEVIASCDECRTGRMLYFQWLATGRML